MLALAERTETDVTSAIPLTKGNLSIHSDNEDFRKSLESNLEKMIENLENSLKAEVNIAKIPEMEKNSIVDHKVPQDEKVSGVRDMAMSADTPDGNELVALIREQIAQAQAKEVSIGKAGMNR